MPGRRYRGGRNLWPGRWLYPIRWWWPGQPQLPVKTYPTVDSSLCRGCGICATVCPTGAIRVENKVAKIDAYRCIQCGQCVHACPFGAIRF